MPKLFISYSFSDQEFVAPIIARLNQSGYEVTPLQDLTKGSIALNTQLNGVDVFVIILTAQAALSSNVFMEMGMAIQANIPIVPFLERGVEIPVDLANFQVEFFERPLSEKTILQIIQSLERYLNRFTKDSEIKKVEMTPYIFAQEFYNYLDRLNPQVIVSGWQCEGRTEIAFGTPSGSWDTEGFLFTNKDYKFVLRSVARSDNSYLVVESVNLTSQLANLALNNREKFKNENGRVSILETYDMTVRSRRTRNDVRNALNEAGMPDQIVTVFDPNEFSWEKILGDVLKWAQYRELAKIILQRPVKNDPYAKFWLLKINGVNWRQDELEEEMEGFFHADYGSQVRPEYERYQLVRPGELGIAIDDSEERDLIFVFQVTRALEHNDDTRERFLFRITLIRHRYNFTIDKFTEIWSLVERFNNGDDRLFEFPEAEFNSVYEEMQRAIGESVPGALVFNKASLSQVFSDSAARNIEDSLGFQKDVDALAAVMVYKEVTPPLAIGLFGNWGSGKSFFMNKLQQKIEELTEDSQAAFCRKVLQINFNSWHYSDANLWASLITKIFEDLEKFGRDRPDDLKELFENLSSTKELLVETKNEKSDVDRRISLLNGEKAVFDNKVSTEVAKLGNLSIPTMLKQLITDASVQEEITDLQNKYKFLKIDDYEKISAQLEEIDTSVDRLIKSIKIAGSFFKGWRLVFLFFTFAGLITLSYYLKNVNEAAQVLFERAKGYIYGFSALFATGINILRPAMHQVKLAYKKLSSLQDTVGRLKARAEHEFFEERQQLNDLISGAKSESVKLETEISQLQLRQQKLVDDLNDIKSGRKVIHFIEGRVADERYANSLGIISWVRRDFEQLDQLLGQQKAAQATITGDVPIKINFELERIVLYIDDLDRCPKETVVKVLEAMNLLLAFPLFVVVVGVDPRWMHNALHQHYPHLKNGFQNKIVKEKEADQEMLATSSDYLEKIFQIPFALKAMNQTSKSSLIAAQLKVKEAPKHIAPQLVEQEIVETTGNDPIIEHRDIKPENVVIDKTSDILSEPEKREPLTPTVAIDTAKLLISSEEERFMQGLAFLIGDSPRTIKRFINIFRILRTHQGFQIDMDNELPYYYAAMIILAVVTGHSQSVDEFFGLIKSSDSEKLFLTVMSESKLSSLISIPAENESQYQMDAKIAPLSIAVFKANIDLVSRFSFSSLQYEPS